MIDALNRHVIGIAESFVEAVRTMAEARKAGVNADVVKASAYKG